MEITKSDLRAFDNMGEPTSRATCTWCKAKLRPIVGMTAWRCPSDICFRAQLNQTIALKRDRKLEVLYLPLPIQTRFLKEVFSQKYRRILFGGSAGVSKSHALRWLGHACCNQYPGFKALLLRRKFPQLEESHLSRVEAEAAQLSAHYAKTERRVDYPNGSRFKFGHCAERGDEVNYLSDEYDLILFDEQTTFEESQVVLISSRARTTRQGWQPLVVGGTNPGGVSANYCRSHYIDKNPDPKQYGRYNPDDYCYIPGTLDDNPYLNESYEKSLDDLPTELREAYRFGNWDIFPGQYFKEWRRSLHTTHYDVPPAVERFCGLDWGYLRPGVCLWFAALPDGRLYVEDEYVFSETIASEVAREIRARSKRRGLRVRYTSADPAMWIRSGESGESIAETFARAGWPLRQSKNERVNGWQRVRHWLRPDAEGKPLLQVSEHNCPYLTRTLPQLLSDEGKPEDVDTSGEDHAADALRYALMSRPFPTREAVAAVSMKGKAGQLFADLRREVA